MRFRQFEIVPAQETLDPAVGGYEHFQVQLPCLPRTVARSAKTLYEVGIWFLKKNSHLQEVFLQVGIHGDSRAASIRIGCCCRILPVCKSLLSLCTARMLTLKALHVALST